MKFNYSVLLNAEANKLFNENGFCRIGQISEEVVNQLKQLNEKLSISDYFNCGFNVGMNTDIKALRKTMQDELNKALGFLADEYLNEYEIYTASFLNKLPREDCFVIAHQDFTYTDETQYPSFMCFIPLVDTTIHNAALGFIPKSHLFFDYIRAFPFPEIPSPVTENSIQLMQYFDVLELKAGELVFFMHNTIHGSFSNYSNALRPAVGLSFIKKGVAPYLFIHNPKTEGKTLLKYKVDKYSLVEYNNPFLKEIYHSGTVELPYQLLDEFDYSFPETSWSYVQQYINKYNLKSKSLNVELINNYNKFLSNKNKKTTKIKNLFKRFLVKEN